MSKKQRHIPQAQVERDIIIPFHGKAYPVEEAWALAIKEQNLENFQTAAEIYTLIVAQVPDHAVAHGRLGVTLHKLQRYSDALASYDKAIILKPDYVDTYNNRGILLQTLKRFDDALASYAKAIALRPDDAVAYYNRGNVLKEMKRYDDAFAHYDKAIKLKPDYVDAYNNRGITLKLMKRYAHSLADFDKVIELKPDYVDAYNNRGNTLKEMRRYDAALADSDNAIKLKPNYPEAYNNRGTVLQDMQRYDEALADYDKAIKLKPDHPEAYNNRGIVLQDLKRYDEALANYDKAITLKPDYGDAYYNKGLLKLLLADFEEGWKLYEWRWKSILENPFASSPKKLWLGQEPLDGKTILLYAEQGLGDIIQLCRYIPLVAALGATVIVRIPSALIKVISTLKGSFRLISEEESLPDFDLHCPFFSLPLALGTTLHTIPADIPYLFADPIKQKIWQEKLGKKTKPRIGLVWSGGTQHKKDHNRSIPLNVFSPLLQDRLEFHCLQNEIRPADEAFLKSNGTIKSYREDLKGFDDTAALAAGMDIIISVDTAVAHLAGALGKPVWILLSFSPDFRWMTERDDSPWYPTAHLFRQRNIEDWEGVILEVTRKLKQV